MVVLGLLGVALIGVAAVVLAGNQDRGSNPIRRDERAKCADLQDLLDDKLAGADAGVTSAHLVDVERRANRSRNVRLARTISQARVALAVYIQTLSGRYESMSAEDRLAAYAPTGNLLIKAANLCTKAGYRIPIL